MLLSFVLDKPYFISNSLRSVIATVAKCDCHCDKMENVLQKNTKSIHLKVICHYCNVLSASQDKENCYLLLYLVNTNENKFHHRFMTNVTFRQTYQPCMAVASSHGFLCAAYFKQEIMIPEYELMLIFGHVH